MKTRLLALVFVLGICTQLFAQTASAPAFTQLPTGNVDFIKASDIADAAKPVAPAPGKRASDVNMLRVDGINKGEYYVGIALLHRPKTAEGKVGGGIEEHSQITEVYHIISGRATFVAGGKLINPRPESPINVRIGPGFTGTGIDGGQAREVGPGDMVIIPPMTPHWFKVIPTEQVVYTVVRIDPHHALSMPPSNGQ